jgi:hypothetical protein
MQIGKDRKNRDGDRPPNLWPGYEAGCCDTGIVLAARRHSNHRRPAALSFNTVLNGSDGQYEEATLEAKAIISGDQNRISTFIESIFHVLN